MLDIQKRSEAFTDDTICSCQKPKIIRMTERRSCICYHRYQNGKDDVLAVLTDQEGRSIREEVVSGPGQAFMADLHVMGDTVFVVWSEWESGIFRLCLRELFHPGKGIVLAAGRGIFHGSITDDGENLLICYDELEEDGGSSVTLCCCNPGRPEGLIVRETLCKGDGRGYYRPVIRSVGGKCQLIAYDCFDGSGYYVAVKLRRAGCWGEEIRLSEGRGWASDASLVVTDNIATVVWQEIFPEGMVSYRYADISLRQGRGPEITKETVVSSQIWYAWSRLVKAEDGRQLLMTGHNMSRFYIRLRRPGEGFGNPVLATEESGLEGAMYADALLDGGQLRLLYQHSSCNGHQNRFASVRTITLFTDELESMDDSLSEEKWDEFYAAIPVRKKKERISDTEKSAWLLRNGYEGLRVWFGDIHGQSNLSDGLGHADQYYHYAMAVAKQDFTALTDHDVFPDVITAAEWEYAKAMANSFSSPGTLATLVSYEWTANEFRYDFGHKNVYYPREDGGLYHASDPEGMTPDRLFARLRENGAIAVPHHPAATWGVVSAATDWEFHDSQVQRSVEIFSRHAPYEKENTASVYAKNKPGLTGRYVQDALRMGYRLGFTAGSDSHQLEHGMEGGILGAFMEKLERGDLFQALYRRTTYATTGAEMLISLRINGRIMGSEIQLDPGEETIFIEADILALSCVKALVLVRNNIDIRSAGGNGRACAFSALDRLAPDEECFYYLRVTLEDAHMGWSSPIWVRR